MNILTNKATVFIVKVYLHGNEGIRVDFYDWLNVGFFGPKFRPSIDTSDWK